MPDCAGVAHLARALPCQGRGNGFESRHSLVLIKIKKSYIFDCK